MFITNSINTSGSLAGDEFKTRWQGRTADELFEKSRSSMPPTSPGSLSETTYVDIIAYILKENQISSTNSNTADSLKDVRTSKQN